MSAEIECTVGASGGSLPAINKVAYKDIRSVLHGARNGLIYGAKIRFPHALVMTLLFKRGTLKDKLYTIIRLTTSHSARLGTFVALYKALMLVLERQDRIPRPIHSFVAGAIGGLIVFRDETAVNSQIVLYLTSRVMVGLVRLGWRAVEGGEKAALVSAIGFPAQAVLAWGAVMWLWECSKDTLPGSLQSSMDYLYADSSRWRGWTHFFTGSE